MLINMAIGKMGTYTHFTAKPCKEEILEDNGKTYYIPVYDTPTGDNTAEVNDYQTPLRFITEKLVTYIQEQATQTNFINITLSVMSQSINDELSETDINITFTDYDYLLYVAFNKFSEHMEEIFKNLICH